VSLGAVEETGWFDSGFAMSSWVVTTDGKTDFGRRLDGGMMLAAP
jgi:hypothetical protein